MQENADLAERLSKLEEAHACTICLDAPRSAVLLPCRHLAVCGAAACAAMLGAPPLCPLCRKVVTDVMPVFTG